VIDPRRARELLDAGLNDQLLAIVTAGEVGLAWCRYAERTVAAKETPEWEVDPDGWAAELYHEDEFWADEEFVRAFLVTIADTAPDEVLGWVGAGPLEDFITEDVDRLAWVESQAARSERFRRVLANVWIAELSPEAFHRIERAAGVPLHRPPGPAGGTYRVVIGKREIVWPVQNVADEEEDET
jgi:hypothetical protein